jgi:hypothetical protein
MLASGAYVIYFLTFGWSRELFIYTQESKSLAYFHNRSGKTLVSYVNYIFR